MYSFSLIEKITSHENKGSKYISMFSKELVLFFSNLDKAAPSNHLHDQSLDSV